MNGQKMDDETLTAIRRIEKLMRLAGSNPNEKEASSALEKAQSLLLAYNLDMTVVEQMAGETGRRVDEMIVGGMHKYQRALWRHIAELNFCYYWTQKNRTTDANRKHLRHRFIHEHRLVGRTVNVVGTKTMASYLSATIHRLSVAKFGTWTNCLTRDGVAYREGIADRVIEKIAARREDVVAEEERRAAEDARRASRAGVSLATTLTVTGLKEKEEAGNYDHLHGEGAWARRKLEEAAWEAGREARRAERAKAAAEAEAEFARWATANPEEAMAEARKDRARERARDRRAERSPGRRYRFRQTAEEMRRDSGSYHAGYEKGEEVSIDPQVDSGSQRKIGRAS
jgi:hypothetical protein